MPPLDDALHRFLAERTVLDALNRGDSEEPAPRRRAARAPERAFTARSVRHMSLPAAIHATPDRLLPPALELRLPATAAPAVAAGAPLPDRLRRGADLHTRRPGPSRAHDARAGRGGAARRTRRSMPAASTTTSCRCCSRCSPTTSRINRIDDYVVWFYTPMALPLLGDLAPRASSTTAWTSSRRSRTRRARCASARPRC